MPTPVSVARQCLAGEAAAALDGAVAIARRRGHAQTTSLHVVSALLSLPSSSPSLLRDALSRARSAVYPSRLQSKALELCFSAALDRLPSAASSSSGGGGGSSQQAPAEPPVSNSLMAAIKRSQANQRRNPDAFYIYQQQQQQQSSPSAGVKVELQQLVLSILDDPVVSRVFGDAGFRSYDIKFAILRPPPSTLRFPRGGRCPPLFLCNFSVGFDDFDPTSRGFSFPFSRQTLSSDCADENCRRIAEALVRKKGRNLLLVGVGAGDATRDFERAIASQNWASFPPEARGLQFLSVEKELSEFISVGRDRPWLDSRFHDIQLWLAAGEPRSSPGIVLCFGDLKRLVDVVGDGKEGDGLGRVSYVVTELTRVVDGQQARLWLMGSAATYETYMKFLSVCPSADKDWDLQLLPITSLKPGSRDLLPRPSSLMESFVPFGGFFPISSDPVSPSSRQYHSPIPCQLCSDKYDEEIAALLKEFSVPGGVEDQVDLGPFQKQTEPISIDNGLDMEKAKDDGTVLTARIMDLKRKWNNICCHQHQGFQIPEKDMFRAGSETFSYVDGLRHSIDKDSYGNQVDRNIDRTQGQNTGGNRITLAVNLEKISLASRSICMPIISEAKNENLLTKLQERPSKSKQLQISGFQSHSGGLSLLGPHDDHTSPSSVTSVSTDLMLGTVHISKPFHNLHGCLRSKDIDVDSGNVSAAPIQCSSCVVCSDTPGVKYPPVQTASSPNVAGGGVSTSDRQNPCSSNACQPFDIQDLKTLCRNLTEKVAWQEDAVRVVTETIMRCKADNRTHGARSKGDIWLNFLGPDRVGKRKIAAALAELLFGSRKKLISVDLNLQDGPMHSNTICNNQEVNEYELNCRGKTVVDHIAGEIRKKPWSVVLLENVDKADFIVHSSLSQAIKTGRFCDSHGREVGISNAVFITTAQATSSKSDFSGKYSEERILAAQPWQIKIVVDSAFESLDTKLCVNLSRRTRCASVVACKRKLNMTDTGGDGECESKGPTKRANKNSNTFLDLNLPVEEVEANDIDYGSDGSNCMPESVEEPWIEEFVNSVDETVPFKPFDFDALADDILKEISKSLQTAVGSGYVLEIEPKVMEQILAATWLSEGMGAISNWIQQVLVRGFIEVKGVHHLPPHSVLRLVACEDTFVKDHAPGIHLPLRILLN